MAKKIISKDIVDEGVFTGITNDAEKLLTVVKGLKSEYKELAKSMQTSVKNNPLANTSDVQNLEQTTKAIDSTTKSIDKLNKAEKDLQKARVEEIKLQQAREKAFDRFNKQQEKNFELQKKQNSVYSQSVKRLRELKGDLKELEITGRTNGKLYKALGNEFVVLNGKVRDAEEGVGEFFRNVGNYPQQLRAIQKELQGLDPSSARFQQLAKQAGELKDKINDAKDATKAFASESKTQIAKNLFGQVVNDLKDLDFKGAADKAKTLASVVGTITFKELAEGAKNFGSALLNLGKAIVANPLGIFVGAITAVVLAYQKWNEQIALNNEALRQSNERIAETQLAIDNLSAAADEQRKKGAVASGAITDIQLQQISALEKLQETDASITRKRIESLVKLAESYRLSGNTIEANFKSIAFATGLSEEAIKSLARQTENPAFSNIEQQQKQYILFAQALGRENAKLNSERTNAEILYKETLKTLYDEDVANDEKANNKKVKNNKKALEQKAFDWESYYDELDTLAANNNEDEIQKLLELENIRFEAAKRSANERYKEKILADKIIEQLEIEHQKNIATIIKKNQQEITVAQGVLDDEDYKKRQKDLADLAKQKEEEKRLILDTLKQITEQAQAEINRRKQAEINALSEQIDERKSNIQRQEALAAQGLQNTLEFEKQKQAEAELERKRLQEEQEKREKRQIFFKSVIASLENAKSNEEAIQSIARATTITAIASTVAGFFKDGVENFKGKGTETSDSNLVAISKGESVVTAKGTRTYEGLATAMNNGEVEKWIGQNYGEKQTAATYNPQLLIALRNVEKAIKEKEAINIAWDSHDTRVETLVRMGYKKTVKHVRGKPRI